MKEKIEKDGQRRQVELCIKMGIVKTLYGEGILRQNQLEQLMARYEKQLRAWENDA
jgi:hypothetical protein